MARGVNSEATMEAQISSEERNLKNFLAERPKVKIIIPRDPQNPNDTQIVGWNGIIYSIPRGKAVDVPDVIANIWQESYDKTDAINQRIEQSVNTEVKVM